MKLPLLAALVAAVVFVSMPASAQTTGLGGLRAVEQPKLITLADAFRMAGERSTDLRLAKSRVDVSNAQVTQAWSAIMPRLTLGGDYTMNIPEQTASFGSPEANQADALLYDSVAGLVAAQAAQTTNPVQRQAILEQAGALNGVAKALREAEVAEIVIQPAHVVTGALTLSMPLFNARTIPAIQNVYAAVSLSKLATRQTQAAVLWGVARTYYQLAATKQLVKTAEEQIEITTRTRDRIKARFDQGYETSLSLERADLDVKKAEQQVRSARGGLRSAKAALAAIIGVVDDFDVDPPPAFAALQVQASYDELLQRAWDNRVDLRVQKEMLSIAERNRTDAWLRLLPSFNFQAQGRYTTNTSGFVNQPFTGAVSVQASLPIFDGGQTIGVIDESNARLNQEILKVRQLEETVERELRGSLDDIALKTENATTLTEVAELAKKTAQNAEELYNQGVARQDDVTSARLGAFVAEVEAQKARLDLENARLGLAYAVGELALVIKADDVEPAPLSNEEVDHAGSTMDKVKLD
jgi:outer membrane protein TolC